jgi:hypothetical protein
MLKVATHKSSGIAFFLNKRKNSKRNESVQGRTKRFSAFCGMGDYGIRQFAAFPPFIESAGKDVIPCCLRGCATASADGIFRANLPLP